MSIDYGDGNDFTIKKILSKMKIMIEPSRNNESELKNTSYCSINVLN